MVISSENGACGRIPAARAIGIGCDVHRRPRTLDALYNFLSTFGGTHFVTPRAYLLQGA